ncbi:MAG: hypothetical protein QGF74_03010 [Candidatus Nanoarchaeia archaeon]|jgi:hypothetical protein|nr:hypothetical protein [Candidatus Nanoarchaeia archaeon]|tara:strand:- start:6351 stop:6734 length:384 start_codon:yes stop_codon:yes gene_type:complete
MIKASYLRRNDSFDLEDIRKAINFLYLNGVIGAPGRSDVYVEGGLRYLGEKEGPMAIIFSKPLHPTLRCREVLIIDPRDEMIKPGKLELFLLLTLNLILKPEEIKNDSGSFESINKFLDYERSKQLN